MQWKNSESHYGSLSISIHWLVALAVYGMFALGLWMVTLGYYDTWYHKAPELHKSIGMVLFAVMLLRVVWRFVSPPPKPLSSYSTAVRHGGAPRRDYRPCVAVCAAVFDFNQWLPDLNR